jgi:phage recombination protein Bet
MKEIAKTDSYEALVALRDTVAPGLTNGEFALFAEMCRATGLNPALKEIWAIKAGGRLQLMTGINGFLKIANAHPAFDGMEVSFEWDGKQLVSSTVKVYRKDRRFPSVATAYLSEYGKGTPIWKSMPSIMLSKCAKSLALREAFVNELGGLYTQEEMPSEFGNAAVGRGFVARKSVGVEASVVDVETGEVKGSVAQESSFGVGDDLSWESKAVETTYDISKLNPRAKEKAKTYLAENCAKEVGENLWKTPIRLRRLTTCVVE